MDADIAWEECIPDLPLDTNNLPPLNALSSSSDSSLQQLDLLDLLTFDQSPDNNDNHQSKLPAPETLTPVSTPSDTDTHPNESLSHCTTNSNSDEEPTAQHTKPSPKTPPSHSSDIHHTHHPSSPPPCTKVDTSQSDLVLELSTRLASAGAEATALRKRVASLAGENRSLRCALDHANARLIAVAQAAAAHPPSSSPVVLGLAQVSNDVASRLGTALTVSDTTDDSPRDRKKRKRVTGAATTMACVMFMWGALVGTPGMLKGSNSAFRSDGNLPAVWKGDNAAAVAPIASSVSRMLDSGDAWQPNCMRVLKELPDGTETKPQPKSEDVMDVDESDHQEEVEEKKEKAMFVDMRDKKAAEVVAHSDRDDKRLPKYSYVLCRDAAAAVDNVKACADKMKSGEPCGQPHTISLIMPAAAAGLEDNATKGMQPALAEVQCSIMSVARIPVEAARGKSVNKLGRVIATVPETGTVIRD